LIYLASNVNNITMAESYLDKPELDNTPQAHPAFKRGKLSSTVFFLNLIKGAISGVDDGEGQISSPQIEAARRAILQITSTLEKEGKESKVLKKALEGARKELKKINI